MKRAALILAALAAILTATAAPVRTATENFVTNKIAEAVAAIPAPDYSTNNVALVETIQAKAPAPGNYAAVSNAAMNAVQTEVDPVWEAEKSGYATVGDINRLNQAKLEVGDFNQSMEAAEERFTSATNELESVLRSAMQNLNSIDGWLDQNAALPQDNRRALADKQDKLPYATNAIPYAAISGKPTNVSAFVNDAGYLNTESDPVWAAEKNGYATKTELASAATNATNYTDAATNAIPRIKEEDIVWLYGYSGITNRVNSKGEMYTLEPPYGIWREYNKSSGVLVGEFLYKGWVTDFGGDYIWTNRFRYGSAISYNPATGKISGGGDNLGNFTTGMNPENGTFVMPEPIEVSSFKWVYVPSGGYSETYYDRYAKASELSTKQDTISDLAAIRSGAALGASALQSESDPTVPQWAKAQTKPTYTASEVGATTPEDVTDAIREQSLGGIWDETLQVWWTPRMRNGSLTYEATTNVNLNAEN